MDTTQIFDEILYELHEEFINEINILAEDDIYWENGWNDVGIIIEEKIQKVMIIPFTDFLNKIKDKYGFKFKIRNEFLFDEEIITISIHIPHETTNKGN